MVPLFLLSYAGAVEPEAGDDPATCGLRNRCSASVSYPGAFFDFGSGSWIRTSDQVVNSHLLYR